MPLGPSKARAPYAHGHNCFQTTRCVSCGTFALALAAAVPDEESSAVPDNAHPRSYAGGWKCDHGYRQTGETCTAVIVPPNAYLSPLGDSWHCDRLFRKIDDSCVAIAVPKNAYTSDTTYDRGWRCEQGYRELEGECIAVRVPANAFPVDSSFGSGWKCQHGYRQIDDGCVAVVVPENGVLDSLADHWAAGAALSRGANHACTWPCRRMVT